MNKLDAEVLIRVVDASSEPIIVARTDLPDWPCLLANRAFKHLAPTSVAPESPFADVIEAIVGRDSALSVSEAVRLRRETTVAVEAAGRDYLLALRPMSGTSEDGPQYIAVYWRNVAGASVHGGRSDTDAELQKARQQIRDLSRDDAVTGLLNARAFREVLAHDWAVASREKTELAIVAFSLVDFDQYLAVFGRHAADSCLRRVAQAIRRCLRRASDVAGRVEEGGRDYLVAISHGANEQGLAEFADRIADAVRSLGLHHPRSSADRYITVRHRIVIERADNRALTAEQFLQQALSR